MFSVLLSPLAAEMTQVSIEASRCRVHGRVFATHVHEHCDQIKGLFKSHKSEQEGSSARRIAIV